MCVCVCVCIDAWSVQWCRVDVGVVLELSLREYIINIIIIKIENNRNNND